MVESSFQSLVFDILAGVWFISYMTLPSKGVYLLFTSLSCGVKVISVPFVEAEEVKNIDLHRASLTKSKLMHGGVVLMCRAKPLS